jgi:hypothetical protein
MRICGWRLCLVRSTRHSRTMRARAHHSNTELVTRSTRWPNRPRRQARVGAPVFQCEVSLAPDQFDPQLIQLQAHSAAAVDQIGQQLDHVRLGQLRASKRAESFAKALGREDFGHRDPQFGSRQINTTWCSSIAANHAQTGQPRPCGTPRRAAAHVVRGRPGIHGIRPPLLAAAAHSSRLKFASLERCDFGKHGSALAR